MDIGHKDIKYEVFSMRLSEEVIEELKKRRQEFKSWNLLLKQLLIKQGNDQR